MMVKTCLKVFLTETSDSPFAILDLQVVELRGARYEANARGVRNHLEGFEDRRTSIIC